MRIKKEDIISGFPALLIRDLLKHFIKRSPWSRHDVTSFLKTDGIKANRLITLLENENICRRIDSKKGHLWENTIHGNALGNAKAIAPISRKKADSLLSQFLERVQFVNEEADFSYRVKKVVVFGSYIDEKIQSLGDIDLAVELKHKANTPEEMHAMDDKRLILSPNRIRSEFDYLEFPHEEVIKYLRARSRYISIHDISDPILKQVNSKIIYELQSPLPG